MEQKHLVGTITKDGLYVKVGKKKFTLPVRIMYENGYPEVLIDARSVGGDGSFHRQSTKPFIGMKVHFVTNDGKHGYNFKILSKEEENFKCSKGKCLLQVIYPNCDNAKCACDSECYFSTPEGKGRLEQYKREFPEAWEKFNSK